MPEAFETARALEKLGADAYSIPLLDKRSLLRSGRGTPEDLRPEESPPGEGPFPRIPGGKRAFPEESGGRATPPDPAALLASADWIVLTSPRGPEELRSALGDLRRIRGRILVLGAGTDRACRAVGLIPDATAESPDSEGLARTLSRILAPGERVVFARNQRASSIPVEAARTAGAEVRSLSLYRMVPRELPGLDIAREHWSACGLDAVAFGSSALVEAWAERIGPLPEGTVPVAWGSECARTVERVLGRPGVKMSAPDTEGLIAALQEIKGRRAPSSRREIEEESR
jgi:uroporphyrinogen III methyltransferase/synthase